MSKAELPTSILLEEVLKLLEEAHSELLWIKKEDNTLIHKILIEVCQAKYRTKEALKELRNASDKMEDRAPTPSKHQ